ncbi:hypothetical protein [Ferrovibrio sp.]|uniref:hypothetical protein n=1 Tax=Ferrovibrio sp. TaxID=1917215 RepID=UPI000CCB2BF0|nr:hypothetical protein [Ferrovibrio sp.]PJI43567.1 MAG: hypothetical protein CTR53_04750 [Ferrovibrio sp.]
MSPNTIFVAILGVTLVNGFVSPMVPLVFVMAPIWLPEFAPHNQIAILYGTSLIVSVSTLVISGVPTAIFERISGRQQSDQMSMLVWLGAAILLTLPGLL